MNPLPCRVVLVTHYFSTHRGGVENVAGQLAERLVEDGSFQVTWFASDCDLPPATRVGLSMAPMRSWNGIERLGLPWPIWGVGSLRRLKCAIAAADIVHLHDFIYFGNLAAFLFAKWRKTPILVTQHIGDIPYRSRLLSGILKLINRSIGRFVLSKADQVVFISDVVRKQFLRSVSFRTEPLFWPNGVDTHVFFPVDDASRNALRETLPGSPKTTVCLFVGRFVEKKGLGILRQLAREFQDVEWWFAGWGATDTTLDPATWRLPNVKVFADRSGASLAELYRAADLLVLPSKGEGFPLVVQESMACGTPAMVSSATASGIPDARRFLLGGIREDVADAAVAWDQALRDALKSGNALSLREAVAEYARSEWSWEIGADRYRAMYRELSKGCTNL